MCCSIHLSTVSPIRPSSLLAPTSHHHPITHTHALDISWRQLLDQHERSDVKHLSFMKLLSLPVPAGRPHAAAELLCYAFLRDQSIESKERLYQ